jgi:hypothetical protein
MKKILQKLILKVKGVPKSFPLTVERFWHTGKWYMYRSDLNDKGLESRSDYVPFPIDGMFMFNPFKCGIRTNDKSGLIKGLVPAFKEGNKIGLYRVDRVYKTGGDDRLYWDDGYYTDLTLVDIITSSKNTK